MKRKPVRRSTFIETLEARQLLSVTLTPPATESATQNVSQSFGLGSLGDALADEPYSMTVIWGDSSNPTTFSLPAPGTITPQTHTYTTAGPETVTINAQDDSGNPVVTTQFTINVAAPQTVITAAPPPNTTATTAVSQSFPLGSFTATNATGPYSIDVNWGDSGTNVYNVNSPGTIPAENHTYASAGSDTISITVIDSASHSSSPVTSSVTVANAVTPTLTVTAPSTQSATINQSQSFTLGSFTQSNATAPYTVTVDWGDGTTATTFAMSAAGTITAQSHTFTTTGNKTISVSVTDSASHTSNTATFTAAVASTAATIVATAPADQASTAGVAHSFTLGSFQGSNAISPYTVTVIWGDGTANTTITQNASGPIAAQSHTYAAAQAYTVHITVTDSASHSSNTTTFTATASSTSTPTFTLTAPSNQFATTGTSQSFNLGSFTESSATAPYTVTVTWGDSTSNTVFTTSTTGTLTAHPHSYAIANTYTVHVTVVDSAGNSSNTIAFTATASATPTPTLTLTAPSNQLATTGTSQSVDLGKFVETAATAPYTVTVNWGDGTAATSFTATSAGTLATQPHIYNSIGANVVRVTVTDSAGHTSNTTTFTVTAATATSPQITYTAPTDQTATIGVAQSINLGSFIAVNTTAPYTANITWGDGTTSAVPNLAAGNIPAQSHTYTAAATETVSVTITDSASHSSTAQQFNVAVYTAGVAVKLAFTTQPQTIIANVTMRPVIVSVEDGAGNIDTADNSSVTLTINGPAGSTLTGTTTVTAVKGIATFSNLSIAQGGTFTLTAADGSDAPAISTAFAVNSSVLSPAVLSSSLPTLVVAGQPTKGTILLNVTNTSPTTQKGVVTFSVYASIDGVVDSSSTLLGTISKKLSIRSGRLARIAIPIRVIPSTLLGSYPLVVQLTDFSNQTAQVTTGSTVTVAAPFLSITAGLASVVKAERGDILTVTNLGNVTDTSQITYTAGFSYDAAGLQPIGQSTLLKTGILHIKPGKSVRVKINAWKSILGGLIYGNPYYLTIKISDASNDTASAVSASSFNLS